MLTGEPSKVPYTGIPPNRDLPTTLVAPIQNPIPEANRKPVKLSKAQVKG